jgi:hypothetical protein
MKKLLLTLAIVASATLSYGQGTIAFGNSIAALVGYKSSPSATRITLPTSIAANYGVFWGTSADSLSLNTGNLGTSSTTSAGIIVAPSVYGLTGSEALQVVYVQIRGWDASYGSDWARARDEGKLFGQTDVRQVTLGPTAGPGQVIWQGAAGTNPNRFNPMTLEIVPEPSTIALGVLGLGSLLFLRRRAK